ncbi:MAG: hypothetical protein HXY41_06220 [Chloroflexi bacterium]|nr:hypothetical protein [Chloroflexota bacterium]
MSEQEPKEKKYTTEWSFSFDQLGESLNRLLGSLGGSDEEVKKAQYAEPVGEALSAKIKLGGVVGQIVVRALTESDNLFEAEVAYVGDMNFTVMGETEKTIELGQKMRGVSVGGQIKKVIGQFANRDDLYWKVGISPNVPVRVELDGSVGIVRLDLSGLRLTELDVDGGVGETSLILPATGARYAAKIEGGVGASHITIPEGAALNLKIEGGVGGIDVQVPEGAAVRIEAEGGLGGVTVPAHFTRTRGGGDFIGASGVWETTGFNLADKQIYIHFEGGVGGLKVV